jgi:signal transduction histidine kinase
MVRVRLRTKFLLSMVLISAGLTSLSLLLFRQSVQSRIKEEIFADLRNSVATFQSFQHEKEATLNHAADLLADLPILRSIMTTNDELTIQDASAPSWRLAGSDLFVLADRSGKVVALHTRTPGFTREMAQQSFTASLEQQDRWWFGGQHLYEVFLKPIYFGPATEGRIFGYLVIGYEIDERVASQISRIAAGRVAFYYAGDIVTSTLTSADEINLAHTKSVEAGNGSLQPRPIRLGNERFLQTTIRLSPQNNPSVRLTVLKSYDQATAFLAKTDRLLLALGVLAVVVGGTLVFFISHTFTRPLSSLVAGVGALERGDFNYELDMRRGDEVAELARAFDRMRNSLQHTQQNLIEAERLATIGRMASSISHDLRHSLAAIVANAEFLCESRLSGEQREELYGEVRGAVDRMTELIDSLLEFSRTRESLHPTYGSLRTTAERAVNALRSNPEFLRGRGKVRISGGAEGWFDHRKLERALLNLLLNACQAIPADTGGIDVTIRELEAAVEIKVSDNGRGIPAAIRNTLFDPFVSQGKENGTGLGLTVVQKIVQDHGGEVVVESSSDQGTVFRINLPSPVSGSRPGESSSVVNSSAAESAGVNSSQQA